MIRVCQGCQADISHMRQNAKACSSRCLKRINAQANRKVLKTPEDHQLVEQTLLTLIRGGQLYTADGQLVLHLAKKLVNSSGESGSSIAALSKEFHRLMADLKTPAVEAHDPIDILRARRNRRMAQFETT